MNFHGLASVILSALLLAACSDTTRDDDSDLDSDSGEGCAGTTEVCPLPEPDGAVALALPWAAVHPDDPGEEHASNVVLVVSNMPFECSTPNGTTCGQWKARMTLTTEHQKVGSLSLLDAELSWERGADDCPHGGGYLVYESGGTLTVDAFEDSLVRFTVTVEPEFSETAPFNPDGDYQASRCPSGG
jgi:hypothetical protein